MRNLTKLQYLGMMCLFALLAIGQAHAQATRTWISGVGDDANPCSRTAPCATLNGAISKTAASGVIDILDPGDFGPVTITQSITLENVGEVGGVLGTTGTDGIIVNGAGVVVTLRGLSIEGEGSGPVGVAFIQGSQLIVERCDIDAFSTGTAVGISFTPSSAATLIVRDTTIHDNGIATSLNTTGGILIASTGGSANVLLDNVRVVNNNGFGVQVSGPAAVVVRNSVIGENLGSGLWALGGNGAVNLTVEKTTVNGNGETGLLAQGASAQIRASNTVITGNSQGMQSSGGGAVISFGNNRNYGNLFNGAPDSNVALQ